MVVGDISSSSRPRLPTWQRMYSRRLIVSDLIVVVSVVYGAQLLWFGLRPVALSQSIRAGIGYNSVSLVIIVAWMIALSVFSTRDPRIIGSGSLEYKRLIDSTVRLFGIFAILAFLFQIELARGYFLTALPAGAFFLSWTRWAWRQWLRRAQARGLHVSRTVIMGDRAKSEHVSATIRRATGSGLDVVGIITRDGATTTPFHGGVPVLGRYSEVLTVLDAVRADTVVLTGADDINPFDMRKLGWDLEARDVTLIVAPGLTGVAGPRIHARPVADLPLIYVEFPVFAGVKRLSKRLFDIFGAAAIIALSSPVLLAVAVAVKTTSKGDVLYRQERIGLMGKPFNMLKFRSMVQHADDQLESLLDAQGRSSTPLFKINDDPRITRVGKFLRRSSLDEFPQLFNVLSGKMSLVGPRPQRQAEVELYDDAAHRRLMMKPGMSGLWQVSGRSRLSWDDAIRLDLYYVENWSMTTDLIILWRTVRAVVRADGAV